MKTYTISCPFCGAGNEISDGEYRKCHACFAMITLTQIEKGIYSEWTVKCKIDKYRSPDKVNEAKP